MGLFISSSWEIIIIKLNYLGKCEFSWIKIPAERVLTKTRNDLKRPTTIYNEQETTWNDPQRIRHNLQWLEHTYNKQRKDAKRPKTSRFSRYFTIWGKRFSSLIRFLRNIWLQLFAHCFMENHGENGAPSIYYHAPSVNYHVYFLRDIRFVFFCLGFMSAGKGRGYFFSSLLPLPPARSSAFVFIGEV